MRILSNLSSAFKKWVLVPYRRHKYISRVFQEPK